MRCNKPNLFIVGAPKCGTTFLHTYLDKHPSIYMSTPKEPRFFCKDFHRESDNYYGYKKY
ncbi:MAG: sulfotransferase [Elusimicrobiota bacterium]